MTESVTNRRNRAEVLKTSQPRTISGTLSRGRGLPFSRGGRFTGRFHCGEHGGILGKGRGRGSGNYNFGGGSPNPNIPETIVVERNT